ncbi:monocarboxylate transporter 7-like isoform X3 [Apostichopus japonicus]|uniref:monocarboxylate transporter 7-like isoform X3 n=1 Tax=Stichopus japonicus TaxID=307972 RepID=UPI003AB3CB26
MTMNLNIRKLKSFVSRCLYKFLLDGSLKAYGVIMEDTVHKFHSQYSIIGLAFSMQVGIGYLIAPLATFLNERFNSRLVAIVGGFLAGMGYIGRALFPPKTILHLLMYLSVSGFGFGLVNVITVVSLKESFEADYATAYSISMFASYIGVATLPPLLSYLEQSRSVEEGMLVLGIITSTLVVTGFFTDTTKNTKSEDSSYVETDSGELGSKPKGLSIEDNDFKAETALDETTGGPGYTETSQLMLQRSSNDEESKEGTKSSFKAWMRLFSKHPEFVALLYISTIGDMEFTSWSIFLVPYGEYLGIDSTTAVWLSTIGGISGFIGRVYSSVLFYHKRMNLTLGFHLPLSCLVVGYVISFIDSTFLALAATALLSGFGISVQSCVSSSLLPSCVCSYHFKHAVTVYYGIGGFATLLAGFSTDYHKCYLVSESQFDFSLRYHH